MENMIPVRVYLGRFGEEKLLCNMPDFWTTPAKGDFVFYNGNSYKVLYVMHDIDDDVIDVFVRMAVEEDY